MVISFHSFVLKDFFILKKNLRNFLSNSDTNAFFYLCFAVESIDILNLITGAICTDAISTDAARLQN